MRANRNVNNNKTAIILVVYEYRAARMLMYVVRVPIDLLDIHTLTRSKYDEFLSVANGLSFIELLYLYL